MNIFQKIFMAGILLFCFVRCNTLVAQPGMKGGVVLSGFQAWQDLEPFTGTDYRPFLGYEVEWLQADGYPDIGFQLGVYYTFKISKYFTVQPELYYSQRGLHFYQTELYNTSYSLNVSYIELPLLLRYKMPLKWPGKPGILAGPYTAFKISANRTLDIWGEENTRPVTCVNNLDYGLVFGINSEFSVCSNPVLLELRLNWGLANMMTRPETFTPLFEDAGSVNVIAITLLTGLRF